jgi:hypothetical protein
MHSLSVLLLRKLYIFPLCLTLRSPSGVSSRMLLICVLSSMFPSSDGLVFQFPVQVQIYFKMDSLKTLIRSRYNVPVSSCYSVEVSLLRTRDIMPIWYILNSAIGTCSEF